MHIPWTFLHLYGPYGRECHSDVRLFCDGVMVVKMHFCARLHCGGIMCGVQCLLVICSLLLWARVILYHTDENTGICVTFMLVGQRHNRLAAAATARRLTCSRLFRYCAPLPIGSATFALYLPDNTILPGRKTARVCTRVPPPTFMRAFIVLTTCHLATSLSCYDVLTDGKTAVACCCYLSWWCCL